MDFRPALSSGRRRASRPLLRAVLLGAGALLAALVAGRWGFERMVQVGLPEAPTSDAPSVTVEGERTRVVLPGGNGSLERVGSGALTVLRLSGEPYGLGHARGRLLEDTLNGLDRLLGLRL